MICRPLVAKHTPLTNQSYLQVHVVAFMIYPNRWDFEQLSQKCWHYAVTAVALPGPRTGPHLIQSHLI